MTKQLRISPELALPLEATTQAIGILAKRRAGKSYTARRFAEQLFKAGQQIVIVDPKGDWWGIRSSADGKSPGLPVVILGGEHGDVPLEVDKGEVVAKLAVEERVTVLLDLSFFRKHEVATFMTAFLENLYRLKAREVYRTPLMLFVDEADAIAPQKPQDNEARMLGAAEDIVRRGGQRGLGCTLITQRSAVLNKNVLTQVEMLVALRTIAPQDLKALDEWINVHGTREQRATLMESLPSLPRGDAWFWSPGWPTEEGIFQRVHVSKIETFDSGATPKSGEKRVEPKNLADVDLVALTKQMAATIEKAKADDPRELRKEIAHLKSELAKKGEVTAPAKPGPPDPAVVQRHVEAGVAAAMKSEWIQIREALRFLKSAAGGLDQLQRLAGVISEQLQGASAHLKKEPSPARPPRSAPAILVSTPKATTPTRTPRATTAIASTNGKLTGARLKIVRALAELEAIGIAEAKRAQLSFYSGLSFAGGYGSNTLGAMRTEGLVDYPTDGFVALTDHGRAAAGEIDPPTSLRELHDRVRRHLSGLELRIFDAVVELGKGGEIARQELGEQIQASFAGGYGSNTLGALRSAGIVVYPRDGAVAPSDLLFPEGLS